MPSDFEALVAEGESVPTAGWDFSWFEGRAEEARPPWGYQSLVAERLAGADRVLDLQTGGGEVTAGALEASGARPSTLVATESWPPNLALARSRLAPWGGAVAECPDEEVPVAAASFDLVVSRHPVVTPWSGVARALAPGGTFLSQQVGPGSVRELTRAMIGPYDVGTGRDPQVAVRRAEAAGLEVIRLEVASLPMTFDDIAAVIVFLRKVIWIVPSFSVEAYLPQLRALHRLIEEDGPFRATSERFLIECRRAT